MVFTHDGEHYRIISLRPARPKEVRAYFKATGPGWQTRMDAVLRQYVVADTRPPHGH